MKVIHQPEDLRSVLRGTQPAFVPTMGALHQGHVALVAHARQLAGARPVVVSVFVNPTQFGPNEDFTRYPRTLEADIEAARTAGADIVFAPEISAIYPPDSTPAVPPLPPAATQPQLEDAFRPGHFAGVCQVVARLFDLVQPSHAIFGEKDYQQLLVIQQMVTQHDDRWPGLAIVPHPTVREADGLAMSSRNRYLQPHDRARARALYLALTEAGELLRRRGLAIEAVDEAEAHTHRTLAQYGLSVDYAVVRDSDTLLPLTDRSGSARGLIAARLGSVRLIDNLKFR